jgi:hypothetical protein
MKENDTSGEQRVPVLGASIGGDGWIATGFFALGTSVGFVSGISNAAVTLPLIAGLLALIGGGIIPFFGKVAREDRPTVGKLLFCFTVAFTIFLGLGIFVKANSLLTLANSPALKTPPNTAVTPRASDSSGAAPAGGANTLYLKAIDANFVSEIEDLCRSGNFDGLRSALNARQP